jgi:hypothetical protein
MSTRLLVSVLLLLSMGCAHVEGDLSDLPGPAALSGLFLFDYEWSETRTEPAEELWWISFSSDQQELILMGDGDEIRGTWEEPEFALSWEDGITQGASNEPEDTTYSWFFQLEGRFTGPHRMKGTRINVLGCEGYRCEPEDNETRTSPFFAERVDTDTGLE